MLRLLFSMAACVTFRLSSALLWFLLASFSAVLCRNFDARFSVIKRGNHENTYFGFSVAQHQYQDDTDGLKNV